MYSPGVVRAMDGALEAYRDVLAASPGEYIYQSRPRLRKLPKTAVRAGNRFLARRWAAHPAQQTLPLPAYGLLRLAPAIHGRRLPCARTSL